MKHTYKSPSPSQLWDTQTKIISPGCCWNFFEMWTWSGSGYVGATTSPHELARGDPVKRSTCTRCLTGAECSGIQVISYCSNWITRKCFNILLQIRRKYGRECRVKTISHWTSVLVNMDSIEFFFPPIGFTNKGNSINITWKPHDFRFYFLLYLTVRLSPWFGPVDLILLQNIILIHMDTNIPFNPFLHQLCCYRSAPEISL